MTRNSHDEAIGAWKVAYPQFSAHLAGGVDLTRALRALGLALWGESNPGAAADVLRVASALCPADANVAADLAGALYASGQIGAARAAMRRALDIDPSRATWWLSIAAMHREERNDADAEGALRAALDLDPALANAWASLGFLLFQGRRYAPAAIALRRAAAIGPANAHVQFCLAECLFLQGDFAAAAQAHRPQRPSGRNTPEMARKIAFVAFLDLVMRAPLDEALAAYREAAGASAIETRLLLRDAQQALSGYGHRDAAIACGEALLALAPDDPISLYLTSALKGAPLARAPDDYIVDFFDRFAATFDEKLVNVLDYRVPQKLRRELAALGRDFTSCLDMGCGTGLAGPLLQRPGMKLVGVDLSAGMLAKAAERGVYDRIERDELHHFLETARETFDLIWAADVLIYVGDLDALMTRAARRLSSEGTFAFSVETTQTADYVMLPSGRFAHRPDYVERLARKRFTIEARVATDVRREALGSVQGMLYVLRKKPTRRADARRRREPRRGAAWHAAGLAGALRVQAELRA